ncbi:hypothetical protein [Microbacterium gorillae]|uniref:hypothetical protein n=1 Tax=Microbacterium gorillae TaxID=1231063 RepID=UPI0006950A24|nr:hypothetical protein [Microbacterium gorillae]
MRTTDFSRAPAAARVVAVVISTSGRPEGATRVYRLPQRPPAHLGTYTAVADAERAAAALGTGDGRAVVLSADAEGYANGTWSTSGRLNTVERFTATAAERARHKEPPLVRPAGPLRRPKRFTGHPAPRDVDATEAGAMFFGATKYTTPVSWIAFARTWFPLVRRMRAMPGYRGHRVYWMWPFTLGTIGFFDRRDTLWAMARGPEHRYLMTWLTASGRWASAGYIRMLRSEADRARP